MINRYSRVLNFIIEKHKGQVDKGGKPYVFHPITVALMCNSESEKIVALLHDILEDTDTTVEELRLIGLYQEEIEAIQILKKDVNENYFSYIEKVAENRIARTVKKADLTHNMDISRLPNPTKQDFDRVKKYAQALKILMLHEVNNILKS